MKSTLKIAGVIAGFIVLAALVLFALDYYEYRKSPEYQALKQYKEWEESYRNDPYGGSTPEETLQLFIDALKKGDIELASKYFIIDEQEKWIVNLKQIQEKNLLDEMIRDLKREKSKHEIGDGQVSFDIANDQSQGALTILLGRGPNNRWKILDL
ncbi:MAG: hypothetical protein HY471_01540 [Candidatus Sungbacteria bacterium]|nr:hypothetical protein [Candidatus Sungbacteria bacterium]